MKQLWLGLLIAIAAALTLPVRDRLPVGALTASAQEPVEPTSTPTPNYVTAPSLPVRGTPVRRMWGQLGPTPRIAPQQKQMIGITINGYEFMMDAGDPCRWRVQDAIYAHADLYTGDPHCDALIKQAREIQKQKEAEDPDYANAPRITPQPSPAEGDE
jgi:hypothetical protein